MKLPEQLQRIGACRDAVSWSVEQADLKTAWVACDRADWMLWLCDKMADKPRWPTRKQVVFAACQCARTSLRFVPQGDLRPLQCIETVEAWTRDEATIEQVLEARRAAYAAASYAYAAYAASYAKTKALKEMADLVRTLLTPGEL
jgi:hypothetical protein